MGLLALLTLSCAPQGSNQKPISDEFVTVQNGQFIRHGQPYYYIGTNFWYGPLLAMTDEGLERLEAELDTLKALGIENLRVLVGCDGPEGIPTRVQPVLQPKPGEYNEEVFLGLDRFMVELGKRDMQAVLYIGNAWEWSGGYWQYLEWAGAGDAVIPAIEGYGKYMSTAGDFLVNEKAKALFAEHLKTVISRTNSITGKPYSEDPAIFSWQICNEPRCFSADPKIRKAFVKWIWDCAGLIREIDANHMISSGNEGKWGCEGDMELYKKLHKCPNIDYLTAHIWPYNWGWVSEETVAEGVEGAIVNTDEYIDEHIAVAKEYGKPVVIEEFGYPRDGFLFGKEVSTSGRDVYYSHVFSRIGGELAGVNFWGWGGLAQPAHENWEAGDDYCGDPAQEAQGLNSVFLTDTTVDIIKNAQ